MAYYGEYDSCQGRNNERIYESPPISGHGYQQQQQQQPRPPCDPCLNVTERGHGFNEYGGPAAYNKYNAGGGYEVNEYGGPAAYNKYNAGGGSGVNEYGRPAAYNKYNAGGGCMMSGQQIIPQGQIVRVCSKANPDYALAIRDGSAVMLFYNPNDPTMQWVKDESWSNQVRDQVGHPAFALVNKSTGQALRHASAECQEVLLTQYEGPTSYDENILWSESEDMGYGYRTVRMVNNIGLNLDAFHGDRRSGGMRDGTRAVLWKWDKQDNQLWKLSPCY